MPSLAGVKKPVRAISGVSVVAVMAKPFRCPHGRCVYCPGGPEHGTPQSYLSDSPAVLRASRCGFDPYRQVYTRIRQYFGMGHRPSKIELIIMGGTFPAMPPEYQEWFVARCLEALNDYPRFREGNGNLDVALRRNERARLRCVGLTVETRPDWARPRHVDFFLRLGATRVELGVQCLSDRVLRLVRRGHGVEDVVAATQVLKDAGYKVVYHIMLGLPGMSPGDDLETMRKVFGDPRFRPDMLKLYPTVVVPGTELYRWWKEGRYEPYDMDTLVDLLARIKSMVPEYVRIMRVQRDIPVRNIVAGPRKGNLREIVQRYMERKGLKCRCIRCREVGHVYLKRGVLPDAGSIGLKRLVYEASGGVEVFLSFEDPEGILIGFLRMRIPSPAATRPEVDEETAIIRELHVYGLQVPVGDRPGAWFQHRGYGSKLVSEAERIAREEYGVKRMLVISGVGVRDYYRRLGYRKLRGSFYMFKRL